MKNECFCEWDTYEWSEKSYKDDNDITHPYINGVIRKCSKCGAQEFVSTYMLRESDEFFLKKLIWDVCHYNVHNPR